MAILGTNSGVTAFNLVNVFTTVGWVTMSIAPRESTELSPPLEEVQRRHDLLEDFFENGAVGLHIVAADGYIVRANKAELALLGYAAGEYVGKHIADFHADKLVIDDILKRLSHGEKLDKYPARLRAKDGSIRHVLITSSAQFRDGQFLHTRCFTIDVTQAKLAEEQNLTQELEFRQLLNALPAAIYTTDASGKITYYNQASIDLAGRRPEIGSDEWCVTWRLYKPDGTPLPHDECPMAIALKENRPIRGIEAIAERPDGSRVPFMPFPTPLRDRSGKLVGAVNMLIDITERKRAEETQQLLIGELNHRVKNTLSMVQALAQQTLRAAKNPEHFVASFGGRIQALARAHDLLSACTWRGVELEALIQDQLLPDLARDHRITLSGPSVTLGPQIAVHMALVLHELGTNARKYGALSGPNGRLVVTWSVETGRILRLRWAETGSEKILSSGTGGFGASFVEQIVKPDGGEARMTCEAHGITWDIQFSLADVETFAEQALSDNARPRVGGGNKTDGLRGKRILLVEDEAIIALELSQTVADAGMEVIGIARTIPEAHRAISTLTFDVALLDANIRGQSVDEIATALERRDIAFAFVSGYGRQNLPAAFRDGLLVPKPFSPQQVLNAIAELLSQTTSKVIQLHPVQR